MKTEGQVFTPQFVVTFVLQIVEEYIKLAGKDVLEPSFGEGVFLDPLRSLGANVFGIEYDKTLYNKRKEEPNMKYGDFLKPNITNRPFDIIIGNPPYVGNNRITKQVKRNISHLDIEIDNNEWNLYYYFIYKSVELLKEKGYLVFITPITFLTNSLAEGLRTYLYTNGSIKAIYSLEEKQIFEGGNIETIMWVFQKGGDKKEDICIGILNSHISHKQKNPVLKKEDFKLITIPHFQTSDFFWNIYQKEAMDHYTTPITDIMNISVGMVSGYDTAFLYKGEDIEDEYIIKTVVASECGTGEYGRKRYIFVEKGKFKTERDFKKKAPKVYRHLLPHKERLENRYLSNKTIRWWEWATIRNKKIFEQTEIKFFFPCITRKEGLLLEKVEDTKKELYGSGSVITLTFKEGISKKKQKKYSEILTSEAYSNYMYNQVPRKGNRKMFSQKFFSTLSL